MCTFACRKKSDDPSGRGSLLRSWGDKDPLKRPSCALLLTLAQAILRHADTHTLSTVVTSRSAYSHVAVILSWSCLQTHTLFHWVVGAVGVCHEKCVMLERLTVFLTAGNKPAMTTVTAPAQMFQVRSL